MFPLPKLTEFPSSFKIPSIASSVVSFLYLTCPAVVITSMLSEFLKSKNLLALLLFLCQ